jgi:hypothetical protein
MNRVTHVIDPDGEVIIVLQNPNAPFAELSEALTSDNFTHLLPGLSDGIPNFGWCVVPDPSEPTQPPFEEPAPEWPVAEETAAEPVEEEPVEEEPIEEEPAEEQPAEEQPAEEQPAEEQPAEEQPAELWSTKQPAENCFRIQVSAKHLILASSVFKKILTGGWKESITYLQKGSVEITADSWDLDALLIMLRIIHCQSYQIPRKMTLEMLAKVSVLADYYDCREPVTFTWINTLDGSIPTRYSRDLILWLWVAWYFHLSAKFKEATSAAMSLSNSWIDNLGLPIPEDIISMGTSILKYA